MPCNHKFLRYSFLESLDFNPEVLMLATFNQAWPANNKAQWFYGRTQNNYFCNILPALYQQDALRNIPALDKPQAWKKFCQTNKIAITDLIRSIGDADEFNNEHHTLLGDYSNSNVANKLTDFTLTDIIDLFGEYRFIKSVYLTTKARIPFVNDIWNAIGTYCLEHNIHFRRLLTPSGSARCQIPIDYVPQFPVFNGILANFVMENWHQKWHQVNI